MKSGEIWICQKGDVKAILKIELISKHAKIDAWKCINLTPDIYCWFDADITPETPRGIWTEEKLPSFIIRDFFKKEYKND